LLGVEQGQPLVEPPLVEQGGLVVEELGDGIDELAVAHADVAVPETRPVDDRRCQPAGDHETTSEETVPNSSLPGGRRSPVSWRDLQPVSTTALLLTGHWYGIP